MARFERRGSSRRKRGEPNLFFDELTPIVEARHGGHELQMFLDTGANETFLYPSFRDALSAAERTRLKKRREETGGVGGTATRTSWLIPRLNFEILGRDTELKDVSLLPKQPAGKSGRRDGVFGMDALTRGYTLDFRAMQFRVQ